MSTAERFAQARQPASAAGLASTALVPIERDGPRRIEVSPGAEKPVNAHVFFYGIGYTGLAVIWAGMWIEGFAGPRFEAMIGCGAMLVALGGFGMLVHTLYRPNERKVRHLLLALAALALTVAATPVVQRISREAYAAAAVDRLQPLADDLARDARIRTVGVSNGSQLLNGYRGVAHGPGLIDGVMTAEGLEVVLARDGLSRGELEAYQGRLRRAGMRWAQRTASGIVFSPDGPTGFVLLYLFPGQPLPAADALMDAGRWFSEPLGGAWHLVRSGRR